MIDYDLLKEIQLYASRHTESSKQHYQTRNQNTDKIFINCFNGKAAEWCNYFSLLDADYIVDKPPCMRIFSNGNKSHDADLIITGKGKLLFDKPKHVHIKSVTKANYEKYGISFLVEKNDPIVINPDPDHFYSVMLQVSLLDYRFHTWINSCDVEWKKPVTSLPSKLACYIQK